MDKKNELLFQKTPLGLGYHNVGRTGLLPGSDEATQTYIENHYGQRCGHIPLNADRIGVLVETDNETIRTQMQYLSELYGRELHVFTRDSLKQQNLHTLIVPYVNMPQTEKIIASELQSDYWGLPAEMTYILKHKAKFYQVIEEIGSEQFVQPEYITVDIQNLVQPTVTFLKKIEEMYTTAGVNQDYPRGVMMRFSLSDGNYGCSLAYEYEDNIIVVPNGDGTRTQSFTSWQEALIYSQQVISATMNPAKDPSIVVSRYIDFIDSPGLSLVMLEGYVQSLLWNGQLQKEGSKACIGTSSYVAKTAQLQKIQQESEAETAEIFEQFLRQTAKKLKIDFNTIRGLANVDIIIPTEREKKVQRVLGKKNKFYFAECNPRWTNYTDAIMTMIGIQRLDPTITSMQQIIAEGIYTIDKYQLPKGLDPAFVRTKIFEKDQKLQPEGTRIIARMTDSPLGLIFAGDIQRAEKEMNNIVNEIITEQNFNQPLRKQNVLATPKKTE
jgi:hypothetical protein